MRVSMRTANYCVGLWLISAFASIAAAEAPVFDLVVYGGTTGGVAAAVQARRMGKSVVLIAAFCSTAISVIA